MADVNINKFRASVVRDGSKPSSPGFIVSEGQDPVNPPGTNNYVPYSGATANVELGEYGVEAGFITLDTTPTNTPTDQGTIFWDADDETVDIILNGYTMKIGEDLFYPVKNQTGSTIAKGVAVRFNGTVGASGRLLIAPFIADGSVASSRFMGVTAEEILNGEDGKVLYFGRVRGINTNAFNEGDILYASTTVAGGYQTAIPLPPNNIVQVAAVVTKSATVGTIFVRPTLGSNINTDEGVKITSVADKNLLQYQSGTSLWENKSLAQVLGGTSAQFVKGDGSLDSTSYGTGTVTSVGLSSATSGVTIGSTPVTTSGTITLAIATASGSQNGLLSSTDWTTFNSKQNALTNPVTGTGTTNYLPKFTGSTTIGNSQVFDSGTGVVIGGTSTTNGFLEVIKSGSSIAQFSFGQSTTYRTDFFVDSTGNFYIQPQGNTRVTISSGGNLLVGTTTDNGAKLQVSGTGNVTNSTSGNALIVGSTYAGGRNIQIGISDGSILPTASAYINDNTGVGVYIGDNSASTKGLYVKYGGNVGIGTASPDVTGFGWRTLTIRGGTTSGEAGVIELQSPTTTGAANLGIIAFMDGSNRNAQIGVQRDSSTTTANMLFYTNAGAGIVERMRITSGGNVGIGTASPSAKLSVYGNNPTTGILFEIFNNASSSHTGAIMKFTQDSVADWGIGQPAGTNAFAFWSGTYPGNLGTERMRITSVGDVYFGNLTVSVANTALFFTKSNGNIIQVFSHSSGTVTIQEYYKQGSGLTGSITYNGTNTLYNATSDYRLKEDLKNYNALQILGKLKTYDFKWKNTNTRDFGMLAHELQEVLPNYVSGQKDELTDDKSIKPQVVDYSKIVPLLIKSIQELKQEIDTLKK